MYQKILKTHKNNAPKGVANVRERITNMKTPHQQKHTKIRVFQKTKKNRKRITRPPELRRFLGHGEG